MNGETRPLDPAIAGWLADGPSVATAETRGAVAYYVRRTPQRRPFGPLDIARQSRLLAAAALVVAAAALAISAGMPWRPAVETVGPTDAGSSATPPPSSTTRLGLPSMLPGLSAMTLTRPEQLITFVYDAPEGFDVELRETVDNAGMAAFSSLPDGALFDPSRSPEPGAHGITVADVTNAYEHGSTVVRPLLGPTADDFISTLDASACFAVDAPRAATIGVLPAIAASVSTEGQCWTHIDVITGGPSGRVGSVEFNRPNVIWVSQVDDALVLVEAWADTDDALATWLPTAEAFVASLRFDHPIPPWHADQGSASPE